MKSNFYEKIIPIENEKKLSQLNKMSKLLDESINSFINLRKRQLNDMDNTQIKLKLINKFHEFESFQINRPRNNNNCIHISSNYLREGLGLFNLSRHERIRNYE